MSQKITSYPGHEITSDELKEGKYLDVQYKFVPRYSWAAGVAISRFLDELKEGRIVARKCNQCERILVPPRMYCEQCYRPTDEWVQVRDTGSVNTFSISHVGTDARRLKTPILVAVVDIDGASPGMGILHNRRGRGRVSSRTEEERAVLGFGVFQVQEQLRSRSNVLSILLHRDERDENPRRARICLQLHDR